MVVKVWALQWYLLCFLHAHVCCNGIAIGALMLLILIVMSGFTIPRQVGLT